MKQNIPSFNDFWTEEKKVRELQILSDVVVSLLRGGDLSLYESLLLLKAAKKFALIRFPDKEETYELTLGSRFRRVLREKMSSSPVWN